MKISKIGIGLFALLLAGGCRIEEQMAWSPDGSRAAVRLPRGLCLMDTNGVVSKPVASNVVAVAWLPDSRGLVVLREIPVTNWQDAARLLAAEEATAVESLARGMVDVLKGALAAADGDASAVPQKFFEALGLDLSDELGPLFLCLRDTQTAALRQIMQGAKNAGEWEKFQTDPSEIKVNELSVLRLAGGPPQLLARTFDVLGAPRPSPTAPVVAFLRRHTLTVAPLSDSTNRVCVAEKAMAGSYGWTPDGQALVYAARLTENGEANGINLVRIERRVAVDAAGALVAGEVAPLALASVAFTPRVHCLPDGRVLFASLALQTPAPVAATQEARLYLVDPTRATNAGPVAIPSPAGALPTDLAGFTPSPDGRQIAIVESGSDVVAVLDVASGAVEIVSPKRNAKCRALPAWRGANELYFAALPRDGASRPEWLRWNKGSAPQVISQQWSDESVKGLVEFNK